VTNDDPALATAEARFRNGSTARQIPYEQGMDPFARPVI
jgi:hypothetical protein